MSITVTGGHSLCGLPGAVSLYALFALVRLARPVPLSRCSVRFILLCTTYAYALPLPPVTDFYTYEHYVLLVQYALFLLSELH